MAKKAKKPDFRQVRVTLVRSPIGYQQNQRLTVQSLGLRKINASVVHTETPQIKGMISTVSHLVTVEEVTDKS